MWSIRKWRSTWTGSPFLPTGAGVAVEVAQIEIVDRDRRVEVEHVLGGGVACRSDRPSGTAVPRRGSAGGIASAASLTWPEYFSVASGNGGEMLDLLVRTDLDGHAALDDPLHARAEVLAVLVEVGLVDDGADGDDLLGGEGGAGKCQNGRDGCSERGGIRCRDGRSSSGQNLLRWIAVGGGVTRGAFNTRKRAIARAVRLGWPPRLSPHCAKKKGGDREAAAPPLVRGPVIRIEQGPEWEWNSGLRCEVRLDWSRTSPSRSSGGRKQSSTAGPPHKDSTGGLEA